MKAFNYSPRTLWRAVTIVALGVIASTAALAMRVSPMVLEMETRGSGAVGRLEIQNLNPGKLAFETRVTRMEFDESGAIKESPADEDFLVFPPQGVLPNNGRQVVRLQWVGPPELPASRAYYVSVNQLPVALDAAQPNTNGAQVQIVYHMKALVVVAPPGASPNIEAVAARPIEYQAPAPPGGGAAPPPGPGVEITLKNSGRRHAMMAGMGWRLEGTDPQGKEMRIDVKPEELNRVLGTGYVPALGERTFKLPLVEAFAAKPIKVSFIK